MLWPDLCQCEFSVWAWSCRKTFHFASSSSVLIPTMGRRGCCSDYIIIPRPRQAGKQWSATTFLFLKYIRRVQSSVRSPHGSMVSNTKDPSAVSSKQCGRSFNQVTCSWVRLVSGSWLAYLNKLGRNLCGHDFNFPFTINYSLDDWLSE